MKRNEFLKLTGLTFGASLVSNPFDLFANEPAKVPTTAEELSRYMLSMAPERNPTVDRVIVGDPNTKIIKAATCWMPYWDTLRKAKNEGANVIVAHEPTFFTHWDLNEKQGDYYRNPAAQAEYLKWVEKKMDWILENKLVIVRNHDSIDQVMDFGMSAALGKVLGLGPGDILRQEKYYTVFKLQPIKAGVFAKNISKILGEFGQPGVGFYGDEDRMIQSIGIGTGNASDPIQFAHMNPDMYLVINDAFRTWSHGEFATDSGTPMVIIDHGTSEEHGMRLLQQHLRTKFPEMDIVHLEQGCSYKWIVP